MRQHPASLILVAALCVLLIESVGLCCTEDPGDWSFRHHDEFIATHFRESETMRTGDRISVLIFGDYQCETRLTVAKQNDIVRAEVVVARGSKVREQLSVLRQQFPIANQEEVFNKVKIERRLVTSGQAPRLSELWRELRALRQPVLPTSGIVSPAVWYQVTAIAGTENHFEVAESVPGSPGTSSIGDTADIAEVSLVEWIRQVLKTIGGEAASAADGGDCGLRATLKDNPLHRK